MFWAACCLGIFGFLQAGEFTENYPFDPEVHLTAEDLQVDSQHNPSCICLRIKCSKTDPFHQGCFIYLGHGSSSMCPMSVLCSFLTLCGSSYGPLFQHQKWLSLNSTAPAIFCLIQVVVYRHPRYLLRAQILNWGSNFSSSGRHP